MFNFISRWFCRSAPAFPSDMNRSPEWPSVRAAHIEKYPACAACGRGDHLNAHHIKPFHIYPELELREDNLITLCGPHHDDESDDIDDCEKHRNCHYTFGHAYDWKGYNPRVTKDAAEFLKKVILSKKLASG